MVKRYDLEHKSYLGDSLEPRPDGDWVSYDEYKALEDKLEDARKREAAYEAGRVHAVEMMHKAFAERDSALGRLFTVSNALEAFVTAAKSWHNFHHGSTNIQCDALCECIPAGEAALSGSVVETHEHEWIDISTVEQGAGTKFVCRVEGCGRTLVVEEAIS